MRLFRHGDVLLQQVGSLPEGLERLPHTILAHGELSGHSHRLQDGRAGSLYRQADLLFLEIRQPTRLIHEEHAAIELTPGAYRVWRQREYSPREIRIVRD